MTEITEKKYIKRAPRYHIDQYVMVSDKQLQEKYHVLCRNISASGILIEDSSLPFEKDSQIYIYIPSIDLKKNIRMTGKVIRIDKKESGRIEYGIQISFLDHTHLMAWSKFVGVKEIYLNRIKRSFA